MDPKMRARRRRKDFGVKEDNKVERGSIYTMKADSKATTITNSSVSASLYVNGPKDEG